MHVDGGAIAQLFLYPPSLEAGRLMKRERHAYIIRNARLDPDYAMAERRTINIAGRAINTMLAASGHNDVLRTYFVSQRDGVDYNLAYIGSDFTAEKTGRVRPGLHAGAVPVRLPAGQDRPGMAQGTARAGQGDRETLKHNPPSWNQPIGFRSNGPFGSTGRSGEPRRRAWTPARVRWKLRAAEGWIMDKATIELLARRAGLAKALAEFPDDVAAAAKQAADVMSKIKQPTDPAAEPWPPMRRGGAYEGRSRGRAALAERRPRRPRPSPTRSSRRSSS